MFFIVFVFRVSKLLICFACKITQNYLCLQQKHKNISFTLEKMLFIWRIKKNTLLLQDK